MAVGDITYSHRGAGAVPGAFACGSFISDISEIIYIYCGFQPKMIKLFLADAGGTADATFMWQYGMAEATNWESVEGAITLQTTKGPYPYTSSTGEGFYVPAAMVGAADSDVVYWQAWR